MFLFPTTILAIVAIALIHHGAGFGLMAKQEKSNELIYRFLEKSKVDSAEVLTGTENLPKFPIVMVDKSASNFDLVLFMAKLMRCPVMSRVITAFYERLYKGKKMTDAELEKMAQMLVFLENGKYFSQVEDKAVNAAVLSLFNRHGRDFMSHVTNLYNTTKEQTALYEN